MMAGTPPPAVKPSTPEWNPAQYAAHGRFVAELGAPLLDWLAPRPAERVLDLGCGDGVLTALLAARGCAVPGVDASPAMVTATRARGLPALQLDGAALKFDAQFDAVFSNAALHWMHPPERVIAGIRRALKPGGRLVAELGGHGNVQAVHAALQTALTARGAAVPQPWFFPTPDACRALLQAAGFTVHRLTLTPRPTLLPGTLADWLRTFAKPFLARLAPEMPSAVIADLTAALRPQLCDAAGRWTVDYVRLRVHAARPAA